MYRNSERTNKTWISPQKGFFPFFFFKKKTFFVLLSILKIKRILKQNRRQPEFVEAASPHGHQPANIGWSSIFVTITIIMVTITIIMVTITILSIIFTITILVFIFIINIIVATIRILFIIVIFNGQDLVALRQFVRIHLGVFLLPDYLLLLKTMKTTNTVGSKQKP